MINYVALMGRFTAEPELKSTPKGTAVTAFTLAVDRAFSKEKETDFINCVAWEQKAEFICKHFSKGGLIAIEGRIQVRNYEDKKGNKRQAVEVVVSNAHFCEKKRDNYAEQKPTPEADENEAEDDFTVVDNDEDLPF